MCAGNLDDFFFMWSLAKCGRLLDLFIQFPNFLTFPGSVATWCITNKITESERSLLLESLDLWSVELLWKELTKIAKIYLRKFRRWKESYTVYLNSLEDYLPV